MFVPFCVPRSMNVEDLLLDETLNSDKRRIERNAFRNLLFLSARRVLSVPIIVEALLDFAELL